MLQYIIVSIHLSTLCVEDYVKTPQDNDKNINS